MKQAFYEHLAAETAQLKSAGLFKQERILTSPQQAHIRVSGGRQVLNLCANNYLGLSNSPELVAAACDALKHYGFGLSSVRFICGTQDIHKALEARIAAEGDVTTLAAWAERAFEVTRGDELFT